MHREKSNYTYAIIQCQNQGGDLANVLSEKRTNALSKLIKNGIKDWYRAAFVGLDDLQSRGEFKNSLDEPIRCFDYRAWSPGQPRDGKNRSSCVALDEYATWRVVSCDLKLSFICELYPEDFGRSNELFNVNCKRVRDKSKYIMSCHLKS